MFPHERSLVQKYRDQPFVLLGVNADPDRDEAQRESERHKLNWRSWWDGKGEIQAKLNVEFFPTLFLLDARGRIRHRLGQEDLERIEELIDRLLAERGRR